MSRKIALAISVLAAWAALASAQTFPMPAATPNQTVPCTVPACVTEYKGTKTIGYPLPPYKKFIGRYVDSAETHDWQAPFRTARAGFIKIVPENGLNGRIYMRVGGALVVYNLDNFFTRIATPPVPITSKFPVYGNPPELYQPWDEFLYPEQENASGWVTQGNNPDGQDRLFDMDWDDRGFIYTAYGPFGWGIAQDDKATHGGQMPFIYQNKTGQNNISFAPHSVMVIKSGDTPYLIVSDDVTYTTAVFDVSSPTTPRLVQQGLRLALGSGQDAHYSARNAARSHVAVIGSNQLTIYPANWFVNGAATPQKFDGIFKSVVFDGSTLWVTEMVNGNMVIDQFTPGLGGLYNKTGTFSTGAAGAGYIPSNVNFQSGYMVLTTQSGVFDVRVFKMTSGTPEFIDLGNYIKGYYSDPDKANGYARANHLTLYDASVYVQNNRTYLILGFSGLGDVYELSGSDGVNVSVVKIGDTQNPNRPLSAPAGPFPGDIVTFNAVRSNNVPINVKWKFGTDLSQSSLLFDNVPTVPSGDKKHQFWDIGAADFLAPRTITAVDNAAPGVTGSVDLTFVKPSARVSVKAGGQIRQTFTSTLTTATAPLIVGDTLVDASDGSVESHYGNYQLSGPSPLGASATPLNETMPASGPSEFCGAYTFNYTAHYAPYNSSTFATVAGVDYPVALPAIHYNVQPFVLNPITYASPSVNTVRFSATARVPANPALIATAGTKWNVTWTLSGGATQATSETIGTIPPFDLALNAITPGSKVTLTVAIPPAGLVTTTCQPTASQTMEVTPATANPVLVAASNCAATNTPCSVSDATAGDDPSWTYAWTLTFNNTPLTTATGGKTFTFPTNLTSAGNYTVNLRVTNVFGFKDAVPLVVALTGPVCGPGPAPFNLVATYSGPDGCKQRGNNCAPGEQLTFGMSAILYNINPECDHFDWDFGDGTAHSMLQSPTHTYSTASLSYNASCTVTSGNNTPIAVPVTVNFGDPPPPPPPPPSTCGTFDANHVFPAFSGAESGCSRSSVINGSTLCKAGENISFTVNSFQYDFECDNHTFFWSFNDGTGATSNQRSPSHAFPGPGTYNVGVTVNSSAGSLQATAVVTIPGSSNAACSVAPTSSAIAMTYSGSMSNCSSSNSTPCSTADTVTFDLQALNYTFGSCDVIDWDFGDGTQHSSAKTPTHQFGVASGTSQSYTVKVTITNTRGSLPLQKTVTVNKVAGQCNEAPTAIKLNPKFNGGTSGCTNRNTIACQRSETIAFDIDAILYNFQSCDNVVWDFGDGSTLPGRSVTHAYGGTAQSFQVFATVTNDSGTVKLGPLNVSIPIPGMENPPVDFTINPSSPLSGTAVKFTIVPPVGTAVKWEWSFGDGNGATRTLPDATYAEGYATPGTYTVTVVARNAAGASVGVASKQLIVLAKPTKRRAAR
jgi:PKD repeat protein